MKFFKKLEKQKETINKSGAKEYTKLNIDEISHKKGYGKFMTVISSEEGVLSVFEGRKCDVIKAELLKITSIDSIKQVSMDLFSPYAKAMREIIPTAVITVDRFHVI